jgi:hypothetical protein
VSKKKIKKRSDVVDANSKCEEIENLNLAIDEEEWAIIEFENEIHVTPYDDVLEHELYWDCWCNPDCLNKTTMEMGYERPIYGHHRTMDVAQ